MEKEVSDSLRKFLGSQDIVVNYDLWYDKGEHIEIKCTNQTGEELYLYCCDERSVRATYRKNDELVTSVVVNITTATPTGCSFSIRAIDFHMEIVK